MPIHDKMKLALAEVACFGDVMLSTSARSDAAATTTTSWSGVVVISCE